ncbi:MAG: c-type cytochrome [Opitutae bacterium]|nr:c-type cytochrome [Opitutae bacterium]
MKNSAALTAALLLGTALTAHAADAKTNWDDLCAKCHGTDGKGQTKMGKKLKIADLTYPAVQAKFTDAQAVVAMKEGITDQSGKQVMKPVEGLSEEDMKALVPLVRALAK